MCKGENEKKKKEEEEEELDKMKENWNTTDGARVHHNKQSTSHLLRIWSVLCCLFLFHGLTAVSRVIRERFACGDDALVYYTVLNYS